MTWPLAIIVSLTVSLIFTAPLAADNRIAVSSSNGGDMLVVAELQEDSSELMVPEVEPLDEDRVVRPSRPDIQPLDKERTYDGRKSDPLLPEPTPQDTRERRPDIHHPPINPDAIEQHRYDEIDGG